MKKIVIYYDESTSQFRDGAFEKALDYERYYLKKNKPGIINCVIWEITEVITKTNGERRKESIGKIYVYHTKTQIVSRIYTT